MLNRGEPRARIFRARGSNEVNRLVDIDLDPYQMGERLIIAGFQAQISAAFSKTRRIEGMQITLPCVR